MQKLNKSWQITNNLIDLTVLYKKKNQRKRKKIMITTLLIQPNKIWAKDLQAKDMESVDIIHYKM